MSFGRCEGWGRRWRGGRGVAGASGMRGKCGPRWVEAGAGGTSEAADSAGESDGAEAAATVEAKARGYQVGQFSFNVKGGRCEACQGDGVTKVEMHFLADVYVLCDVCNGQRYNEQTLDIKYKNKNISQVLNMTVEEGLDFFDAIPKIKNKLSTLNDVGLGYITLGQSAITLSGGEAQRIKLAKELSKRSTGKTLFILDEPTNDLDLETLELLEQRLVDVQGTVLVVSHDREFLDNVVTSVIAFEPEGVREYVGGYSDWLRQRGGVGVPKKPPGSPSKKLTTVSDVPGTKTQKLSYKDKRELEKLPARIESLEAEVAGLHELMGDASFYRRSAEEIASTQKSLQELEARVATAYSRWQKLEQSVP